MTIFGLSHSAQAALNSYAYGLTSELDGNTLTVSYSLNADATSVKFIIKNVDGTTDTVTLTGKTAGNHPFTYDVSTRFSGGVISLGKSL